MKNSAIQKSLFEEFPDEVMLHTDAVKENLSLQITDIDLEQLTPGQRKFNNLVMKIESMRRGIEKEKSKIAVISDYWITQMMPVMSTHSKLQVRMAHSIDGVLRKQKMGVRQKDRTRSCICELLDQAAAVQDLEEADILLYEHWAGMTYEESMKASLEADVDAFFSMMTQMTGIELEKPEITGDEGIPYEQILKQAWDQINGENEKSSNTNRRKTKKQMEKESLTQAAHELEKKSVRSIYISLAKVLHPDMESDPVKQADKKTLMQKLTNAYEANDLHTLLTMEMEWITRQTSVLSSLTEEKLSVYLEVLKSQIDELREEKNNLYHQVSCPGLTPHLLMRSTERATKIIQNGVEQLSMTCKDMLVDLEYINNGISKKEMFVMLDIAMS